MKKAITFYYDENSGEMSKVELGKDFKNEIGLMQVDVLKDIVETVAEMYNNGINFVFDKEKNKYRGGESIPALKK